MFITKNNYLKRGFDWDHFFSGKSKNEILSQTSSVDVFRGIRDILKENRFQMALVFNEMMKKLLSEQDIPKNSDVLELGAATGFLTRWLLNNFGGKGLLIDNNKEAYNAFLALNDKESDKIDYLIEDIFQLNLKKRFSIVCSFGLIEHFKDKKEILRIHKEYLSKNGLIIIIVPKDTLLTRVFMEVHPELNLGYRELLSETDFKEILSINDLRLVKLSSSSGYSYDYIAALCNQR